MRAYRISNKRRLGERLNRLLGYLLSNRYHDRQITTSDSSSVLRERSFLGERHLASTELRRIMLLNSRFESTMCLASRYVVRFLFRGGYSPRFL